MNSDGTVIYCACFFSGTPLAILRFSINNLYEHSIVLTGYEATTSNNNEDLLFFDVECDSTGQYVVAAGNHHVNGN